MLPLKIVLEGLGARGLMGRRYMGHYGDSGPILLGYSTSIRYMNIGDVNIARSARRAHSRPSSRGGALRALTLTCLQTGRAAKGDVLSRGQPPLCRISSLKYTGIRVRAVISLRNPARTWTPASHLWIRVINGTFCHNRVIVRKYGSLLMTKRKTWAIGFP